MKRFKGQWIVLGCNDNGFWPANRFYHTFQTDRERETELTAAIDDASYWQGVAEFADLYIVVEAF